MSVEGWTSLIENLEVIARPESGLWTVAYELVEGPCELMISATGTWHYAEAGAECGPDGARVSAITSSRCINDSGPVGALIGKLGGSTAAVEGTVQFVAGRFCVVSIEEGTGGALFLTINDTPAGLFDNCGALTVCVAIRRPPASSGE